MTLTTVRKLSQASQLPQGIVFQGWSPVDCGSWLACDEFNSVCLKPYFFFFGLKYLVNPWNQITSAGLPLIWIDLS